MKKKLSEKSLSNLKPLTSIDKDLAKELRRKGQAMQAKGKREKKTLTQCLKLLLEQDHKIKDQVKTGSEWLTVSLFQKALKGDVQAQKMIFDRIEGIQEQNLIVHNTPTISFEIIKK